jgi:hypothetical protein
VYEIEQRKLTDDEREKFLEAVAKTPTAGNTSLLRQLGVAGTKGELRAMLAADPDLQSEAREARGYGDNAIRNAMYERGIVGWDETHVTNKGDVYTVRKYSDRLLAKMADMYLPEARDVKRVELTGAGGQPVQVEDRSSSLADAVRILVNVGAIAGAALVGGVPSDEVPAARTVLAAPQQG